MTLTLTGVSFAVIDDVVSSGESRETEQEIAEAGYRHLCAL
jgi:orotate phosphoribosyltransferase